MKLKKPQEKSASDAKDFISGADYGKTEEQKNDESYPWEGLDTKKMKVFSLRIPLDLYTKLQFLGDELPRTSMNNLCLDAIEPYIEEKLKAFLAEK